jgi:predicted amidohydrolase
MKISVVSYSLDQQPSTLKEWEAKLTTEIEGLIQDGAKVILYPELCLMGLSDYFPGELQEQYHKISAYLDETLLPNLVNVLKGKDLCLCLGSGPRVVNQKIYNSSPIWINDSWMFQDKIHLTPWETDFTPGESISYFEFHKLRCACVICFDIEQPGLGLALKRNGVDFILVPSATSNKNGNQRVNRCASGRSIETGAAIVTAPLVGKSKCDLIDNNEGRQGFFMPAQEIVMIEQEMFSAYSTGIHVVNHYFLEVEMMKELKKKDSETKPFLQEDRVVF